MFILRTGHANVTTRSNDGKTVVVSIARPGAVLGVSACILGAPYEISAETIETEQVSFVRREDFLRFIDAHSDAAMHAAICCEVVSAAKTVIGAKQGHTLRSFE